MKKWMFLCLASFCLLTACEEETTTGDIYGVVTIKETAEPMRATGVELYLHNSLLLKTVTYDDGHYEFDNLQAGEYVLQVTASGYEDVSYNVVVEAGRTARADMQLVKANTHMTVYTLEMLGEQTFRGRYESETAGNTGINTSASEVGFLLATSEDSLQQGERLVASFIPNTVTPSKDAGYFSAKKILPPGVWYYQAYATNVLGTAYGEVCSIEIKGLPVVTTLELTNLADYTATLNGTIDYVGDPPYYEKGFVYSAAFPTPTVNDPSDATTKVVVPGTDQRFSANISGLAADKTYYIRAYATNTTGTAYGEVKLIDPERKEYLALPTFKHGGQTYRVYPDLGDYFTWSQANALCENLTYTGYDDWMLPSKDVLMTMYLYKYDIGGFWEERYWSSSNYNISSSHYRHYYYVDFEDGSLSTVTSGAYRVRPVRLEE